MRTTQLSSALLAVAIIALPGCGEGGGGKLDPGLPSVTIEVHGMT